MSMETIQKRARKLLSDLCLLPIRKGQDAEIALIVAALTPQWQPIETAPRDGTLIMLGRAGDEADDRLPISAPGRWFKGYEDGVDYMGHDDGFMDVDFDVFDCPRSMGTESYRRDGYQPTHWMPMPEAPEVA